MVRSPLARLALLALLLPCTVPPSVGQAQSSDLLRNAYAMAQAGRLADAEAEAARLADPLAAKLFRWWRLTLRDPNHDARSLARFLAENPDWPQTGTIALRAEEAFNREPNHAAARGFFAAHPPRTADGWLRLAEAEAAVSRGVGTDRAARSAWVLLDAGQVAEDAFLARRGGRLRDADHAMRFARLLEGNDREAARRQAGRLTPARRPAAEASLAIVQARSDAEAVWAALPEAVRREPWLLLARTRMLRRAERDREAAELIIAEGGAAEAASWPDSAPAGWREQRDQAFWTERNILARRLLRAGDAPLAYRLAASHRLETEIPRIDAEFLAGFVALRNQGDPAAARAHFARLRSAVKAAISIARAEYWTGRAFAAERDLVEARARFAAAAQHPSTFYGQLGAFALGESEVDLALRLQTAAVQEPTQEDESLFRARELARAAVIWSALDDRNRARQFLLRLEELGARPVDRLMAARLATDLGLPVSAAWIARRAATRDASLLLPGWPAPYPTPEAGPERALLLAVMRQESNFDEAVVSPVGARGLMQLMPATARAVGRQLGLRVDPAILTVDTRLNVTLGARYLGDLLDQFGQAVPLAVAGYNAGPHRVATWLDANGDPRTGAVDPIDWIERIPFEETRNYVMRVVEGQLVYRALLGRGPQIAARHPVLALARECGAVRC